MLRRSIPVVLCALFLLPAGPAGAALVGWWSLDETTGSVTHDGSGQGNDGTVLGTPMWVPGQIDGALQFDGSTYVNCGNKPVYNITDAVTLAAWVQPDPDFAYPDWSGIIMRGGPNIDTFALYYNRSSEQLGFKTTGTTPPWFASGANTATILFNRDWHHVAATYDGATKIIYVDGAPLVNSASTGPIETSSGRLLLGAGRDTTPPTLYAVGKIDDAQVYDKALTAVEIRSIMEGLISRSLARDPSPKEGAADVLRDAALAWTPGAYAATHDVYLGNDFVDVNTATRGSTGLLVSQGQTATTYTPNAPLDFGTTYYWRIDEVNQAPDNTIYQGIVWSFTTEPYGYPVQPVKATASSYQPDMGPEKTIDGSGLTGDLHGTQATTMWLSAGVQPNWIQYEFDQVYKLHDLKVWNSNQIVEPFLGFSAKEVTIETSTDGTTWTPVADVPQFSRAPGAPDYAANTTVDLGDVEAKYVKLTINANWGGVAPQAGLAEVRFTYVPLQAYQPQPANTATGVSLDATLNWRPGREATSHQVYFGTGRSAVADGTVAAKTVTEHSYLPGSLDFGTTYYWKVDEVGAVTYPGNVWSFSTQEYEAIDDFESYTDQPGEEIFSTWIDGFTTGLSGSTVGYLTATGGTFGETIIVHGGRQSMPLAYDNTAAPFLSEAERTFDTARNWTTNGADSLVVYFRGPTADNSAEGLYVTVKDTSGKTKVVQHPDPAATAYTTWQTWTIPLSEFTAAGVKMTAVKSLTLGVGNKAAPKAGGTGTVYIDDVGFGKSMK